jgi:hypothetical protein
LTVSAAATVLAAAVGLTIAARPALFSGQAAAEAPEVEVDGIRNSCAVLDPLRCAIGSNAIEPTFALWGDSHAAALKAAVEVAMSGSGRSGILLSREGCGPLLGSMRQVAAAESAACAEFRASTLRYLQSRPSVDLVFVAARWSYEATGRKEEIGGTYRDFFMDDESKAPSDEENLAVFARSLRRTIRALRGAGKRVVLIGEVPVPGWDVPTVLALARRNGAKAPAPLSEEVVIRRQSDAVRILSQVGKEEGAFYLSLREALCGERCRVSLNGSPLYYDDAHISVAGARQVVGPYIKSVLRINPEPVNGAR